MVSPAVFCYIATMIKSAYYSQNKHICITILTKFKNKIKTSDERSSDQMLFNKVG